jgi:hypothetical protein
MSHGDTAAFDHISEVGLTAESRLNAVTVVSVGDAIVGIIVDYDGHHGKQTVKKVGNAGGVKTKTTIKIKSDDYINHISGRAGNYLDHLTIRTKKGQTIDVGGTGGSPFDLNIPEGSRVCAFQGGIGGHLHNISAVFKPLYNWTAPVKSAHVGMTHGDTRPWDHLPQVLSHGHISSFRIAEVHAVYGQYVVGLRVVYEINGARVEIEHYGSDRHNPGNATGELVLDSDDYIVEVSGNTGNLIDRVFLRTHKGKTVSWGGSDGAHFDLNVPAGKRVVGFAGGSNGHLHNFGVYFN